MNVLEKLESIAAEVVQLAPSDRPALVQLEQQLRDLGNLLDEADQPLAAEVSRRSAQTLGSTESDASCAADILDNVAQVVADLQKAIYCDHRNSAQADLMLRRALMLLDGESADASTELFNSPSADLPEAFFSEPGEATLVVEAPDPELLAGFLSEAQEHLESADIQLLTLEREPLNEESLGAVFRAFHTIKGVAGFLGLAEINGLSHEAESLLDKARRHEVTLTGQAMEAVFAAIDALKRLVASLSNGEAKGTHKALVERTITLVQAAAAGRDAPAPGPTATAMQTAKEAEPTVRTTKRPAATTEVLKVDRYRLDRLVDMIGELVIAESMIHRHLGELGNDVAREAAQLNKITRNLQQLSLSLRMVPLRGTFQKMARLVRDVAKKVDKPVDFQCYGEDTELDKTVVDQIGDPLVHMIRNSVDHGIEPPSERLEQGKPAHGTVTLRAFHRGGNIYIEIEDDGRGLDPKKILAKARQKGLVLPETQLNDAEILDLIFTPGFSTADQLTDLSGRGVGMDVVRRNVEAMRGSIELRSTLGRGTCFMLRLPLTLAIIDGMVVRIGQQRYIIPTLSIVELLRPSAADVFTVCERGEYLNVRDEQIVMLRADALLGGGESQIDVGQGIVVLVEAVGMTAGLLVDEVLGQQQAVIKKLGGRLDEQLGLSGGAIMPDGTVGLILDVQGLLQLQHGKPLSDSLSLQ